MPPRSPKEGSPGYLDEVLVWVRTARDRLGYLSQLDQNYVLAVSVKELAKSDWESGRASSQWTFEVPDELFKGQAHVRLRGLGLAVAGEPEPADSQKSKGTQKTQEQPSQPQGFWSATLTYQPTQRYAMRPAAAASWIKNRCRVVTSDVLPTAIPRAIRKSPGSMPCTTPALSANSGNSPCPRNPPMAGPPRIFRTSCFTCTWRYAARKRKAEKTSWKDDR